MFLETKRLIIRSIQTTDEKAFIEMASDGSLTEIYGDCSECDQWMGDFIREAIQLEAEDDPYHEYLAFAIEDKSRHLVIGSVGSSYYEDFREVGVTYFIGADYRGNGYAAEALQCLVNYLFANYNLKNLLRQLMFKILLPAKPWKGQGSLWLKQNPIRIYMMRGKK